MTKQILQYVRKGRGRKCGLLYAEKLNDQGEVVIGWSLCSKEDKFTPTRALQIASHRAQKKEDLKKIPLSIQKRDLPAFIARVQRYFGKDFMTLANQKEVLGWKLPEGLL